MNPAERARRGLLGAACLLVLALYGYAARSGPLEAMGSSAAGSYYNLLVRGFQSGHLSLAREAPAALTRLPDPYDPVANVQLREAAEPLHDLSFYRGKLYLYFGVGPALLLFWPFAALTGHYLLHRWAAAILAAAAFLAASALLRSVQRRYFPETRAAVLAAGVLALGCASGLPILLARADVYEVAIAGGGVGVFLALAGIWRALLRPREAGRWLAAASLAYGLAVASRPSLLPGAAILLLPVWAGEGERRRGAGRRLGAAAGPLVVVGLGLLAYNFQRFGQPLEFGLRYQLAGGRQEAVRLFDPRFLWYNFRVYFLESVRWTPAFPFVGASAAPPLPPGHHPVEDPFGVLADVPLAWLALAAPLCWWRRPPAERAVLFPLALAAAWLAGTAVVTLGFLNGACSRYEVDFLPELILLAGLGILGLERSLAGGGVARRGWTAVLALLFAGSVAFNLLAAVANYARSRGDLGGLLLDAGRTGEAIEVLEGTLRWQPGLAAARIELGDALVRQGRTAEGLAQFAEVRRRDPENFAAGANLAGALAQGGRFAEAAAEYGRLVRQRPDYAAGYRGLGFALARLGRRGEAITAYQAELRLDPADADSRGDLGQLLAADGRLEEAAGEFRAVLRADPGNAAAHGRLGLALAELGRMGPAAAEFQEAVRLDPGSARFHNYLGSAWANQGRLPEAIAEFEAALRLNPAEPTARENLEAARALRPGAR